MRTLFTIACACIVLLYLADAEATTRHVPTPTYPDIQAGITAAVSGDTVLVAAGTYSGVGNRDISFGGKAIVVRSAGGAAATHIDCIGSAANPHRGFIFNSGETNASVLDGFTIEGGYAQSGGAIYCQFMGMAAASPTIKNNVFTDNVAEINGGAIHCSLSGAVIENNHFERNSAQYGGAICASGSPLSPSIQGNTIHDNAAENGGGVAFRSGASSVLESNTITLNTATVRGGGIYCASQEIVTISSNDIMQNSADLGGGIHCQDSSPNTYDNDITSNTASYGGGVNCENASPTMDGDRLTDNHATAGEGGGMSIDLDSSPLVRNCTFTGNTAVSDGGGAFNTGSPQLEECTFDANEATGGHGGGLSTLGGTADPSLVGCFFTHNSAPAMHGGGVAAFGHVHSIESCTFANNVAGQKGGGLYWAAIIDNDLDQCTFYGNGAPQGAAIAVSGQFIPIVRTIMAFNTTGEDTYCEGGGDISLRHSDVYGNAWGPGVCIENQLVIGIGNMSADPLFCDAGSEDFTLYAHSPCLYPPYTTGPCGAWGLGCYPELPPSSQTLTTVVNSDAAWGDFNNDGYPDLVYCGLAGSDTVTLTYENVDGTLTLKSQTDLVGVFNQGSDCLAWGDVDNDGDLDLAVTGRSGADREARIYMNDGAGNLSWDASQDLHPVAISSVAWGDVDHDGDLDLYLQGHDGAERIAKLYVNSPQGVLSEAPEVALTGLSAGAADWADYDGDGDLDLVCAGSDGTSPRIIFYENDPVGTLTDTGDHGVAAAGLCDIAWGDCDDDGDLDLARTGNEASGGPATTKIYRNDGAGNFVEIADLLDVYRSSVAWADYDNDGDLDLAAIGRIETSPSMRLRIFRNDAGNFRDIYRHDDRSSEGDVTWIDVDRDGRLELFVTGGSGSNRYAHLHEFADMAPNTPPSAPEPRYSQIFRGLRIAWEGATDAETPDGCLCYCLQVGTSPGADDVFSGTYDTPLLGNVGMAAEIVLDVPYGEYYWRVRAVDSGLMTSSWSGGGSSGGRWLDVWYLDDDAVTNSFGSTLARWERMDSGPLWQGVEDVLSPANAYYADSGPLDNDFSGYRFAAEIWLANELPDQDRTVTVQLRKGGWGDQGVLLAAASQQVTNVKPVRSYVFDFGAIGDLELNGESLVLKIMCASGGESATYLAWDGEACPSALRGSHPAWQDRVVSEGPKPYDPEIHPEKVAGGKAAHGGAADPAAKASPYPIHPPIYWYDVTPGGMLCDFHVQVYDSIPEDYTDVTLPAPSWQFAVHKVGNEWWASWWDETCLNAIFGPGATRFQFRNTNAGDWGAWRTTITASSEIVAGIGPDPYCGNVDLSALHGDAAHGYGYLVKVPVGSRKDPAGSEGADRPFGGDSLLAGRTGDLAALRFGLRANLPNPFNPMTQITYAVPLDAVGGRTQLQIFDLRGRLIRTLVDEDQPAGIYTVTWNGTDRSGSAVASGVYLYRLSRGQEQETRRMMLIR